MSTCGILEERNFPVADFLHLLDESDRIDCFGSKWKDRSTVFGSYLDIFVSLESFNDILLSLKNAFCFLFIAFYTVFQHRSPCSYNHSSWSASSNACGGINAAFPLCVYVQLILSEFLFSKHQNRSSFWSISILIWVNTYWSHALYLKIIVMSKFITEFFYKWINVTSQTSITMTSDTPALSKFSNFLNWIKVSITEIRTRSY